MQHIWFWYGVSSKMAVTFVKWQIMRMHTGGDDTNKLGVGAVVYSDWWFRPPCVLRRQRSNMKIGFELLRPYWDLFKMNKDGTYSQREFKRPTVEQVRRLEKRRRARS